MKTAASFFRLIRWPNLVFIIITQLLFYYCIITPVLSPAGGVATAVIAPGVLLTIILASVFIAAAGYIINDYFDINIDRVNKPDKMVIEKMISRRWAILLHLLFTAIGLMLSAWASVHTSYIIVAVNTGCAFLLWVYSTTFKRKLLSGNIIISLLTAWVVMVLYFAVNTRLFNISIRPYDEAAAIKRVFKFAVLYGGFAFIISLIREVVKDIEDIAGDQRDGCKTMPVVWGVPASKVFVGVWMVVLTGAIAIVIGYMLLTGWMLSSVYCLLFLVIPITTTLNRFYKAQDSKDYHQVSQWIKLIMLLGILSMIILRFYLK